MTFRVRGVEAGPLQPVIMAVINRSTDSFYTSAATVDDALCSAEEAVREGARILDIGGVRAGRGPAVSADEEIALVAPVISALAKEHPDVLISCDTYRAPVARAAAEAGAGLINDTWAGVDPDVAHAAAEAEVGLVCSHTGGLTPRTDAHRNRLGLSSADVMPAVMEGLERLRARALEAGVDERAIILDPTPDFGKNTYQSAAVMRDLGMLTAGESAVMLAISRKDFVGELVGSQGPDDRLAATIAATALAVYAGAAIIRTHDTAETRQAIDVVVGIRGLKPPVSAQRGLR